MQLQVFINVVHRFGGCCDTNSFDGETSVSPNDQSCLISSVLNCIDLNILVLNTFQSTTLLLQNIFQQNVAVSIWNQGVEISQGGMDSGVGGVLMVLCSYLQEDRFSRWNVFSLTPSAHTLSTSLAVRILH